jgi:hypothetical protein
MSGIGGSGSSQIGINRLSTEKREKVYRTKEGDVIPGGNARITKGDFAHFMGIKPATEGEKKGETYMPSKRVIELALRQEMQDLGANAMKNAASYRNQYVSDDQFKNLPGREKDLIKENFDSLQKGMDKQEARLQPGALGGSSSMQYMTKFAEQSRKDNYRYLEAQYRSDWASKSVTMISTMMKTRHESIKKSFNEVK